MIQTYIAASTSQKDEVRWLADQLKAFGYNADMRWLNHEFSQPGEFSNPRNYAEARSYAIDDVEDAAAAEIMIVLLTKPDGNRWGRLVELGIGIVCAEEVWIVGPKKNIFCYMDGEISTPEFVQTFRHFISTDELLFYLKEVSNG